MNRPVRLLVLAMLLALVSATSLAAPATAAKPRVKLSPILSGYTRPLLITNQGATRHVYIVEQGGMIERATYRRGAWRKLGTFMDIRQRVNDPTQPGRNEQGLLGLAFHPEYVRNGRFYVYYTREGSGPERGDAVLAEYRRASAGRADPGSERIIMVIEKSESNHNGGHLAFGPDGLLYLGLGDGGGHEDPDGNGQDLGTLWGSMLRIDPLDPDGDGPETYAIPSGNPYVGKPGRDEIWANGLRNPWRYSFDAANGNLWIGDVGEGTREEIDKARSNRWGKAAGRGKNFGWSACEGDLEFKDDEGDPDDRCSSHVLPVHAYANDPDKARCSVTGGHVHRGPDAPRWKGLYIGGDFCGAVFVLGQGGKRRWARDSGIFISSFGQDAAGRLFATGIFDGRIYRVKLLGPRP